jgi:hypothetical protein
MVECHELVFSDLEMAIEYWNIVLRDKFKFLDLWTSYLMVSHKDIMGVRYTSDCACSVMLILALYSLCSPLLPWDFSMEW